MRDLAALNTVEVLTWGERGRMTDACGGGTGAEYDALLDEVARVCGACDPVAVRALHQREDLRVPQALVQ